MRRRLPIAIAGSVYQTLKHFHHGLLGEPVSGSYAVEVERDSRLVPAGIQRVTATGTRFVRRRSRGAAGTPRSSTCNPASEGFLAAYEADREAYQLPGEGPVDCRKGAGGAASERVAAISPSGVGHCPGHLLLARGAVRAPRDSSMAILNGRVGTSILDDDVRHVAGGSQTWTPAIWRRARGRRGVPRTRVHGQRQAAIPGLP